MRDRVGAFVQCRRSDQTEQALPLLPFLSPSLPYASSCAAMTTFAGTARGISLGAVVGGVAIQSRRDN